MKKVLLFALAAFMLMTACQATPEAEIVVEKNTDQMIGEALLPQDNMGTSGTAALRERLNLPEVYSIDHTDETGKYHIVVKADIIVPDVTGLPVARVEPADFSQELVYKLYDYLCGGTPMYERPMVSTKAQIEAQILSCQQAMAESNGRNDAFFNEVIANLEKSYSIAPDELTPVLADGTLQSIVHNNGDVLDGVSTRVDIVSDINGKGIVFMVFNNTQYESGGGYSYLDDYGNTQIVAQSAGATFRYWRVGSEEPVLRNWGGHEIAQEDSILSITAQDAVKTANEFLLAVGVDYMRADAVRLMSSSKDTENIALAPGAIADDGPGGSAPERQGYEIVYLHTLNGVLVTSDIDYTTVDSTTESPAWWNEKLSVLVDDAGIAAVSWEGPLTVTEVVTADANVLSFPEIAEIFQKMMRVKYEPAAREYEQGLTYEIVSVRLSLQRVSEQNSFTSGLLVPVWNFYGREIYAPDEKPYESPWPYLTVNAIDGSIIDLHRGY